MRTPDPHDPDLPETLRRELREVFGHRIADAGRADDAVRTAARLHLRRRRGWVGSRVRKVAVAAAAVVLLALSVHWVASLGGSPVGREVASADFDGSGRVDILDAYRMALRIARAEPVDDRWDLDGDGRIDEADVDLVARRAVAIGEPR